MLEVFSILPLTLTNLDALRKKLSVFAERSQESEGKTDPIQCCPTLWEIPKGEGQALATESWGGRTQDTSLPEENMGTA